MNIVITGSNGFLGSHLMRHLADYHPYGVASKAYDLRREAHIDALFKHAQPDIIFHLAANVGGIKHNLANPASIYYDNVMMNTQLIHKAMLNGVKKFIFVGSVCSYPDNVPMPTSEKQLWQGYPEESNSAYGISKLVALEQLQAYQRQYAFNFAYPILSNLYGSGDSGFFEQSKAHLIPSLIKKFVSNPPMVQMFGKGLLTRDFLYVEDACQALSRFIKVDYSEPINIATGREVSKLRLTNLIVELTGYKGKVEYDGKPDEGQLKRCYTTRLAKKALGWQAQTDIKTGLQKTIEWYKEKIK